MEDKSKLAKRREKKRKSLGCLSDRQLKRRLQYELDKNKEMLLTLKSRSVTDSLNPSSGAEITGTLSTSCCHSTTESEVAFPVESIHTPIMGLSNDFFLIRYAVVMNFPCNDGDEDYGIVLDVWLFKQNNKTFCKWPPKREHKKNIKALKKASDDWEIFEVKVKGIFDTYEQAREKERRLLNFSATEDEDNIITRKKSNARETSISPPPSLRDYQEFDYSQPYILPCHVDPEYITMEGSQPVLQPLEICRVSNSNENDILSCSSSEAATGGSSNREIHRISESNENDILSCSSNEAITDGNINKENDQITDISNRTIDDVPQSSIATIVTKTNINENTLEHLSNQMIQLLTLQEAMYEKLKNVEKKITLMTRTANQNGNDQNNNMPNLPLNSIEDVRKLEMDLKNHLIRQNLERFLSHIDGKDERQCVFRILNKTFSIRFSPNCSWAGRNNNFEIKNWEILSVIKDASRRCFPLLTDASFEMACKDWFRAAGQRFKRTYKT